jgi:hypothetical protein
MGDLPVAIAQAGTLLADTGLDVQVYLQPFSGRVGQAGW